MKTPGFPFFTLFFHTGDKMSRSGFKACPRAQSLCRGITATVFCSCPGGIQGTVAEPGDLTVKPGGAGHSVFR